jgi:arylsulfatase A-like enzyme
LGNPAASWSQPAVTTYERGNHAVRTEGWRYIRYADGGEELYDEAKDPYEWTNLAAQPRHAQRKAELAALLPASNAPDVSDEGGPGEKKKRRKGVQSSN